MREKADVTKVDKHGEIYTVHGVSNGEHVAFHVDAKALESMPTKDAKDFMRRNLHNLTQQEE